MIDQPLETVLKLIQSGESETVEFKESLNDEAFKSIGAFSNSLGGVVFIGVSDKGEVCGCHVGKKTLEDIANRIQEITDPRIQPSLSVIYLEDKSVVMIDIGKSSSVPVSVRGRFFRRLGKTDQRMSHEEIMQRITASTGLSWDAKVESGATISDLDSNLIDRFVQTANKLGRRPLPEQMPMDELLRKLELVKDGAPTRAALLLFGKNPETYFPSAYLKIGRFRSPTLIVDDREVHGSLIHQLDDAMAWFRDRLATEFIISGNPEREVRWEYPLSAVREAVINALCHRDFTSGAHSQIRLYDDHLEFWNSGVLPPPLTADLLYQEHDSIPRNRKIAEVFFYMGLIERWGSGTLRITEELKGIGLPKPGFISESGRFKLVFYKELLTEEKLAEIGLSERQLKAVAYVRKKDHITNMDYQQITAVSKRTASRDLNDLVLKEVLVSEGGERGRGKRYRLKAG